MWKAFQKQEAEKAASICLASFFFNIQVLPSLQPPMLPRSLSCVFVFLACNWKCPCFLTSRFGVMNVLHMFTGLVVWVVMVNPIWQLVFHLLLAQGQFCVDTESGHVQGSAWGCEVVCQSLCVWMCRRPSCYTTSLALLVISSGDACRCYTAVPPWRWLTHHLQSYPWQHRSQNSSIVALFHRFLTLCGSMIEKSWAWAKKVHILYDDKHYKKTSLIILVHPPFICASVNHETTHRVVSIV